MKTRNFLLGLFTVFTFTTYAQSNQKTEKESLITEFKIETNNVNEFKSFDWNTAKDIFNSNKDNQEITLVFAYVNDEDNKTGKSKINNFEYKITGKTGELDMLIAKTKKAVTNLVTLKENYKG